MFDLAIIGSGTTGIAVAVEAKALGIGNIILLEKGDNHSMTIRKFYKDGKRVDKDYKGQEVDLQGSIKFVDGNKESTLELFDSLIASNGLDLKTNCDVEKIQEVAEGFEIHTSGGEVFKSKFAVISIGKMGQPNKPSYAIPLTIRSIVNFNANSVKAGEKLLIIGGGNSAVEYAYDLCNTNPTTLNYRRTEFARINDTNAEELNKVIKNGKLQTKLGVDIVTLSDEGGKVGVQFADGSQEVFDRLIYAIGGATPLDFLQKCKLKLDESNTPISNAQCETSIPNLFIAGDIALQSGGSIAIGLNQAYIIAQEIAKRI
ncbi:pyridine nucleotide-disulfide oxidoreductase [Helicobacter enhydrae]|uniref:Pyridine nucleotide-disulfide oxidoreductase n=1 Tax=Helicobacter enhydrae TaxID=222136 RepID=A0A1B1U4T6_9HELI|nr:NAD(P)-binding domain-containing protein [Helicobacter enhydrae]ANV97783.1 pyridine nucleotide-disulfide oxidoreductase [Helicobacter enhydrae]